jgi:hypothetical protein
MIDNTIAAAQANGAGRAEAYASTAQETALVLNVLRIRLVGRDSVEPERSLSPLRRCGLD